MEETVNPTVPDGQTSYLIQLHIAEYQALTTRNTYWMTMQFALFPMLLLFMALVAQLWNSLDHAVLLWGSALVAQLIVVVWYQAGWEQYNNVRYMERELRPSITNLLRENEFWKYELYLRQQRSRILVWWEYPASFSSFVVLLVIAQLRRPWLALDYYAFAINALMFIFIVWLNINLVRTRHDFFPDA